MSIQDERPWTYRCCICGMRAALPQYDPHWVCWCCERREAKAERAAPPRCVGALLLLAIIIAGCTPAPSPPPPAPVVIDAGACHLPDPTHTPGKLCSATDPDLDGYAYPEHIAHCRRNVGAAEKGLVAGWYGVARADYASQEFDHRISLALGGSNDPSNVWAEPRNEALLKDRFEESLYLALSRGEIAQADAVARILAWRCP